MKNISFVAASISLLISSQVPNAFANEDIIHIHQNNLLQASSNNELVDTETVTMQGGQWYSSGSKQFTIKNSTKTDIDLSKTPINIYLPNDTDLSKAPINIYLSNNKYQAAIDSAYINGKWVASSRNSATQYKVMGTLKPEDTLTANVRVSISAASDDIQVKMAIGDLPPANAGEIDLAFRPDKSSTQPPKSANITLQSNVLKNPMKFNVTDFTKTLAIKDLPKGRYHLFVSSLPINYDLQFADQNIDINNAPFSETATYSMNDNYKSITVTLKEKPFNDNSHFILPESVSVTTANQMQSIKWNAQGVFNNLKVGATYNIQGQELTDGKNIYTANTSVKLKNNSDVTLNYGKESDIKTAVINFKVDGLDEGNTASAILTTQNYNDLQFTIHNLQNGDNQIKIPSAKYDIVIPSVAGHTGEADRFDASTTKVEPIHFNSQAAPAGWAAGKITMGTIFDNSSTAISSLSDRPVSVIFTYAGMDGAGDRGQVMNLQNSKIPQTLGDAAMSKYKVNPVFVIYTANASGGGTGGAIKDINDYHNLDAHYETLIIYAKALEAEYEKTKAADEKYNTNNAIRPTVILSPDFIGSIFKDNIITPQTNIKITDTQGKSYQMRDVLANAIANQYGNTDVPSNIINDNSLASYIHSINFILGKFAPDIPYGWEDADWAGDGQGNLWLHQANITANLVSQKIKGEVDFINALQLMTPIDLGDGSTTQPSYIAFDKYGANPIYTTKKGGTTVVEKLNQGYLFNASDWDNYITYVTSVAKQIKAPLMLFQMPGAHLPTVNEQSDSLANLATLPDYLFGNQNLDLSKFSKIPGEITYNDYYSHVTIPGNYLLGNDLSGNVWKQSRINKLLNSGLFAVLWGGGGFATGIIPEAGNMFDDGGDLYNLIKQADNSSVDHPQIKDIPDASFVPEYQCSATHTCDFSTGDYVKVTTQSSKQTSVSIFQCGQYPNWCDMPGYSPAGANGKSAWIKLK